MACRYIYTLVLLVIAAVFTAGKDHKTSSAAENVEFKFAKLYRVALPTESFPEDKIKSIDRYFRDRSIRGYFNGVVLVADTTHIFTKAYGYANRSARERLNTQSVFQIASISKTITATAVIMLAQDSLIDLRLPVSHYLKGFPYSRVTLEMLLNHKSGLADYTKFSSGSWTDLSRPMSNEDMLSIMIRRRPRSYMAAGYHYRYCNTNYALLACIVERITGEGFASWVHKNIFEPVGMENTFFVTEVDKMKSHQNQTMGYSGQRVPEEALNFLDGVLGDKGVYSTVEDLLKFDRALTAGFLVSPQWEEKVYKNYTDTVHPYGYGWRIYEGYKDRMVVYHNGWWHGYRGRFLRLPREGKTVIILENATRGSFSVPTLISVSERLFGKYVPPVNTQADTLSVAEVLPELDEES